MGRLSRWIISPLDVLFFRGGEPFVAGETRWIESSFPPTPETMFGFVRSALLIRHCVRLDLYGARQGNKCPECPVYAHCTVREVVGLPKELPRSLGLIGPYLLRQDPAGCFTRLFSAPSDLVSLGDASLAIMAPGEPVESDLGKLRFTVIPAEAKSLPEHSFITEDGLTHYLDNGAVNPGQLQGKWPDPAGRVFDIEPRVGLTVDPFARTAKTGMLYSIGPVRLMQGFALGVEVEGSRGLAPEEILRLGGAGRVASVAVDDATPDPAKPRGKCGNRFKVVLLQPAKFGNGWLPDGFERNDTAGGRDRGDSGNGTTTWHGLIGGVEATLVSACLGRAQRIGGWNMVAGGPKPMAPSVTAGSVYYFEAKKKASPDLGSMLRLGRETEAGFGQAICGRW